MFDEENENLSQFATDNEDYFTEEHLSAKGFEFYQPKTLRRTKCDENTYDIFTDKIKFESIVVESIINGINEGAIKSPYKIINTHSRIPDILLAGELEEYKEEIVEEIQEETPQAADSSESGNEEPPQAEEAQAASKPEEKAEGESTEPQEKPDEPSESAEESPSDS